MGEANRKSKDPKVREQLAKNRIAFELEEARRKAREYEDSLTPEQKAKRNEDRMALARLRCMAETIASGTWG